jgi:hypothetical protein
MAEQNNNTNYPTTPSDMRDFLARRVNHVNLVSASSPTTQQPPTIPA